MRSYEAYRIEVEVEHSVTGELKRYTIHVALATEDHSFDKAASKAKRHFGGGTRCPRVKKIQHLGELIW